MTTVRQAEPHDTDSLVALTAEMGRFYGATDVGPVAVRREQLRAALFGDPSGAYALVACDANGSIVGFAAYSFLWPAVGLTRSLYLKEFYVARHAQRSGIGTNLMRALAAQARDLACSRIEWTTDHENAAAQTFYSCLGFERLPSKVFYRIDSPAP